MFIFLSRLKNNHGYWCANCAVCMFSHNMLYPIQTHFDSTSPRFTCCDVNIESIREAIGNRDSENIQVSRQSSRNSTTDSDNLASENREENFGTVIQYDNRCYNTSMKENSDQTFDENSKSQNSANQFYKIENRHEKGELTSNNSKSSSNTSSFVGFSDGYENPYQPLKQPPEDCHLYH